MTQPKTRASVVAAARSLLDTPYHPFGRMPGVGVDCVGLPILAVWISGVLPKRDIQGYSQRPDGTLMTRCDEEMDRVAQPDMVPGDIVVCRWGKDPHHFGVVGDWRHGGLSIIHAENYRHKKVVEHRLAFDGAMKFVAGYRIRGLEA